MHLQHFVIHVISAELADEVLACIAANCKQLRYLDIAGYLSNMIHEEVLISAMKALPGLRVITMRRAGHLTMKTLEAIVLNRLHLEKFYWGEHLDSGNVDNFREMAKKAGLVPVPRIVDGYDDVPLHCVF